jgi:glycosyltransferase involved in cell wall biosynthesis
MTDQSFDLDRARSPEMDLAPEQAVVTPPEAATVIPGPGNPPEPESRTFTPRDQENWLLANRVEQLHRSASALRGLVARSSSQAAHPVTVTPRDENRRKSHLWPSPEAKHHPWWPVSRLPETPMQPSPGFDCFSLGTEGLASVAVNLLGLRGADLDHAVALIAAEQAQSRAFKPVFLTDSLDFGPMVQRGLVAEQVAPCDLAPAEADGIAAPLRSFLDSKWGFGRHLDLRHVRAPAADAPKPVTAPAKPPAPARRKRAAVVTWDLGHNPAGRAMVIYDLLAQDHDVELVGPLWSRFGGKVWGPIAGGSRKVRGFPCDTLEDFWPAALAFASAAQYDVVVVCKPRLPALVLGALLKKTSACPLVLDVDDFELSFFPDESMASLAELDATGAAAMREPYGELATRACEGLIADADAVIVSNIALRQRYGGTIVRHARDEQAFLPARFDRGAERRAMGITEDDFALVFVGTARAHKGVFDVARTLAQLTDKRFVLHLVGDIPDRRVRNELDRHAGARIVYHPNCPFDDLPARIVAADAVVLLQDAAHPISKYQIPAKVSDASAFGLPILATDVAPLRDLALQGLVTTITPAELAGALASLIEARENGRNRAAQQRVREAFEAELGFRVNRERLAFAMARAAAAGPGLPRSFEQLIEITGRAYAELRVARAGAPAKGEAVKPTAKSVRKPAKAKVPAPFDLVMFWKQNDSGIYGRRSDMIMKHLLASGRVGRILQIDAPLEVTQLALSVESASASAARHILANTIDNQFGLRDSSRHLLRTYLWDRRGRTPVLPHVATSLADYPAWVEAQMAAAGIKAENALAWVCPVVFDFPAIAAHIGFRGIIGDLIDDQRNFDMQPAYRERVVSNYEQTLPLLDIAFTNCAPQVRAFAGMTRQIEVVPNGTELVATDHEEVPESLSGLPRPVAGYVGNLRDRFDWALLRDTALLMPQVTFAIVGGGARDGNLSMVEGIPNIHFTGVVPYDRVQACIRSFDVALVLHTRDALTDSMNPLKIYNYFAARRPIVSTEVDNIDPGIRPFIRFAATASDFAAAIAASVGAVPPHSPDYDAVLDSISWESRAARILSAIDAAPGLVR